MISDSSLLQVLKDNIESDRLVFWNEAGAYVATMGKGTPDEVRVEITNVPSRTRTGTLVQVKLRSQKLKDLGKPCQIIHTEPSTTTFTRSYETEDEKDLAALFRELHASAVARCARREIEGARIEASTKEIIHKQILGFRE